LDYTSLDHPNTGPEIQSRITSTADIDVRYPTITSLRRWEHGTATALDINTTGGAMRFDELFPAIKAAKIFEFMETKYSITFTGLFLSNKKFTNLFTWWKNREAPDFSTAAKDLEFGVGNPVTNPVRDSVVHVDYRDVAILNSQQPAGFHVVGSQSHTTKVYITAPLPSTVYFLDVYLDGIYNTTHNGVGTSLFLIADTNNGVGLSRDYTFKIRSNGANTFGGDVTYQFHYVRAADFPGTSITFINETLISEPITSVSTAITTDFSLSAPDIKIVDYFNGILKMFHLTITPTDTTTFQLEPVDDWYKKGDSVNITPFVDTDTIGYSRVKLFNKINFGWQKSKSEFNEEFEGVSNRQWGSLSQLFTYDGGVFDITLPFENFRFVKIGDQVHAGFSIDIDGKPFIPKPVMLYLHESDSTTFKFFDGSVTNDITSYVPLGQDVEFNSSTLSMNWGNETSTLLDVPVPNSLYKTYYDTYFLNLYNPKTRLVTLDCQLPNSIVTGLELNDEIIVRDKSYRINNMKSNLVTGLVKFQLINNFTSTPCPITEATFLSDAGTTIIRSVLMINNHTANVSILDGAPFISVVPTLPATFTVDTDLTITVPANATGLQRSNTIVVDYVNSSGVVICTDSIVITQDPVIDFIITQDNIKIITQGFDNLITQ